MTRVLPFGDAAISDAAALIADGGIVAVPTETVYGLAGDATSDRAVAAIYTAKGRPDFNPLIVHVRDLEHAMEIGDFSLPSPLGEGLGVGTVHANATQDSRTLPTPTQFGPSWSVRGTDWAELLKGRGFTALDLAKAHWPGPLTIVVPLRSGAGLAGGVTAGLPSVALRVPAHRAMRALLDATGKPLAAPSANASGGISPTRADHVLRSLDGRIPLVIDDGATSGGIESTIVTVTDGQARLLRPGSIVIDGAMSAKGSKIEAPGQLAAHYAPSKPLRINATAAETDEWHIGFADIPGNATLSATGDLAEAASRLFDLLHRADAGETPRIAVAPIPQTGIGIAINDRLHRAAVGSGGRR